MKFHVLLFLKKIVEKVQVLLKSDKNNRYSTGRPIYIYDNTSLNSSENEDCVTQNLREKTETHFMFSNFFFENV